MNFKNSRYTSVLIYYLNSAEFKDFRNKTVNKSRNFSELFKFKIVFKTRITF